MHVKNFARMGELTEEGQTRALRKGWDCGGMSRNGIRPKRRRARCGLGVGSGLGGRSVDHSGQERRSVSWKAKEK